MSTIKAVKAYSPSVVFFIILVLAFFVIKPFITAILAAFVLSYIFYPLYNGINKKIKMKNISSLITLIIIILVITLPGSFVVNTIVKESYVAYLTTKQVLLGDFEVCEKGKFCTWVNNFEKDVLGKDIKTYLKENIEKFSTFIISRVSGFIVGFAGKIINIFIFIFLTFFLLRDGKQFGKRVGKLLLMRTSHRNQALREINDLVYAVVFGTIIISLVQGTLGSIGFWIFGINSPVMWGFMMAFASLIPFIGSTIIWVPAGLFLIITGIINSQPVFIWKGIGLLIYGTLIIAGVDNIIRPKIIGDRSILHPTLVLLGVTGGITLFGFIGVIVGPVILALLVIYLRMYETSLGKHMG